MSTITQCPNSDKAGLAILPAHYAALPKMVAVTLGQAAIWYFSDDEPLTWFEKCTYGKAPPKPVWTEKQQNDAFAKALEDVGASTQRQQ